jgi:ATP-binding cassette subfamily F protein 3
VAAPVAAPAPEPEPSKRVRPEREARAAAGRMAKLEEQVAKLEARRTELEARLADPDLWSDADVATGVVDELSQVQREIEATTLRWEELLATT